MPLLVSQIYASYLIYFFTCFIYSFSPKLPPFILYIYFIFLFFLFLYNIYIYSWWWANGPFFVLYYGSLIKNTRRREKSHFSFCFTVIVVVVVMDWSRFQRALELNAFENILDALTNLHKVRRDRAANGSAILKKRKTASLQCQRCRYTVPTSRLHSHSCFGKSATADSSSNNVLKSPNARNIRLLQLIRALQSNCWHV